MASIKFSVHPLFVLFGALYALTNQIFVFLIYTTSALLHELGHSFVAEKKGYKLDKICLMPYGAVVSGDTDVVRVKDDIVIALAGPMLNFAIYVVCVATWWFFPISYPFTEIIATANLSLCVVNLLPLPALDGGRILNAVLKRFFGEKVANTIGKILMTVGALLFFTLFVLSCAHGTFNASLLVFSLFLAVEIFDNKTKSKYVRFYFLVSEKALKRGVDCKKMGVSGKISLKKLCTMLKGECLNEVDVYSGEKIVRTLNQNQIIKLMESGDFEKSVLENISLVKF